MSSDKTFKWLEKAHNDFISAEHLFYHMHPKQIEISCYLCQQSAEKMLKAFLVDQECQFQKTHNLVMLCQQCAEIEPEFSSVMDVCTLLTPYAIQTRYPNPFELTESEAELALKKAKGLYDFIAPKLNVDLELLENSPDEEQGMDEMHL